MRVLFFLGVLAIGGLIVTGAIHLQKKGDTISIEIDKTKVKDEAQMVIDKGEDLLQDAEARLQQGSNSNPK